MNLRILSDIHIELVNDGHEFIKSFIPNEPSNNVLVLAGDIGNPSSKLYETFLTEISKYYAKVFIITGNHEYYQGYTRNVHETKITSYRHSMEQIDEMVKNICGKLHNVHFLQRNSVVYNRVRFIGCTLWSHGESYLAIGMHDYVYIQDMTVEKSNSLHEHDVEWLEQQLSMEPVEFDSTVVITHHLPTLKLIATQYKNHPLNCFFATDLDYLVEAADIWICGHSHCANHITIGNCRCYLNPAGCPNEKTGYNPELTVEIPLIKDDKNIN